MPRTGATSATRVIERRVLRRRGTGAWLTLVVLIVSSGSVMALVAGGRRAATSYDRLVAWSGGSDVETGGLPIEDTPEASAIADGMLRQASTLPPVEASWRSVTLGDGVAVRGEELPFLSMFAVAFESGLPGRAKVLAGRLADPDAVDEGIVPFTTADRFQLRVGDTVEVLFRDPDDYAAPPTAAPVRIVGIVAGPGLFPSVSAEQNEAVVLTPAFLRVHAERVDWTNGSLSVRLRDGADAEAFRAAVADAGLAFGDVVSVADNAVGVRRLMRIEAGVLWVLAGVLGLSAAVVIVQLVRRSVQASAGDLAVLASLGSTPSDVARAGARHGVGLGVLGAVGGCLLAVSLSGFFPRGLARTAEPSQGLHVDAVVLLIGMVATIACSVAVVTVSVAVAARQRPAAPAAVRPRVTRLLAVLRPAPATGVRLAVQPGGSSRGQGHRLGLLGLVVVLGLAVMLVSMQASFDHVLDDPTLSGATWDLTEVWDDPAVGAVQAEILRARPEVQGITPGGWTGVLVNGTPVFTVYLEPDDTVFVATDRGRRPVGDDEIALGAAEMAALGVGVGDTVHVATLTDNPGAQAGEIDATVTGRAILVSPRYQALGQGRGAAVSAALLRRLGADPGAVGSYFVKVEPGAQLGAVGAQLEDAVDPDFWFARPQRSAVSFLDGVRDLPRVILTVLGLLAAAALLHRLLVTGRAQRRDLAVLRSMGFTTPQLATAGGTEGVTIVALALVAAVPLGLLGAVVGWRRIADYLAVVPDADAAAVATVVVAGAAIVVGGLLGLWVALRRRRVPAGVLLRSE